MFAVLCRVCQYSVLIGTVEPKMACFENQMASEVKRLFVDAIFE